MPGAEWQYFEFFYFNTIKGAISYHQSAISDAVRKPIASIIGFLTALASV